VIIMILKSNGTCRFWCQAVLPLTFDDSISYYEAICKLANSINNIVDDLQTIANEIEQINNRIDALIKYVNNYFDNLDLTSTITNVINKMYQEGDFNEIIHQTIVNASTPIFVEDPSDMTDINRLYVLISNQHIYQYDGNEFTDTGAVYGCRCGSGGTFNQPYSAVSNGHEILVNTGGIF